jgi:dihydropteroate synthase
MREIIASQPQCDVVIMHNLGVPVSNSSLIPSKENPVDVVHQWAEVQLNLLSKQGISENRIILDIGIGYGKTAAQSLALIREIERFRDLNTRLLVGHSRKSFLQQFTVKPAAQRDIETVVLSLYLANKQVNFLRVHDVMAHARAFKVANACGSLF